MPQVLRGNIDILDTITPSSFKSRYHAPKRPLILTKYTSEWQASKIWTPSWFLSEYRDANIWVSPLAFGLSHPPNYEIKMRLGDFMSILERQQMDTEEFWVEKVAYRKGEGWIATRRHDGEKVNLNGESESELLQKDSYGQKNSLPSIVSEGEDSLHSVTEDSDSDDQTQHSISNQHTTPENLSSTSPPLDDSKDKATVESKLGKHTIFYCQQCPTRTLQSLTSYYPHPDLFDECKESVFGANSFFIGSRGIRTTLHYDRPLVDNLFCQVYGKKRVRLYAPEEGIHFYPFPFESKYGHVSRIPEIDHVDSNQFPNFHKAKLAADVILEPGDALYIPKGWWHHVEHNHSGWDQFEISDRDKLSISLNFWFY